MRKDPQIANLKWVPVDKSMKAMSGANFTAVRGLAEGGVTALTMLWAGRTLGVRGACGFVAWRAWAYFRLGSIIRAVHVIVAKAAELVKNQTSGARKPTPEKVHQWLLTGVYWGLHHCPDV